MTSQQEAITPKKSQQPRSNPRVPPRHSINNTIFLQHTERLHSAYFELLLVRQGQEQLVLGELEQHARDLLCDVEARGMGLHQDVQLFPVHLPLHLLVAVNRVHLLLWHHALPAHIIWHADETALDHGARHGNATCSPWRKGLALSRSSFAARLSALSAAEIWHAVAALVVTWPRRWQLNARVERPLQERLEILNLQQILQQVAQVLLGFRE
mmetsp:Transcript_13458/g.36248  ORF Transcript_13458/g.36248 Transcript_13458/m.36248 type:complete len:212 (-) Transcript_13458:648-1283(-)